jgi:hypothetical protein
MGTLGALPPALRRPQALALGAAFAVLLFAVLAAPASWNLGASGLLRDFNAFYCAGAALDAHADPYLAEPLGTCERAPHPWGLASQIPHLSMPAPLPPYALAPFALLAHLPYGAAALVWFAFSLGCVIASAWALRAVTGLPFAAMLAALALGDGYAALSLGQVVPLAVAGLSFSALALARGRLTLAACCAALAMIEPHVGLPACLALFLFVPGSRAGLFGCALAGVALSFAAGGQALNLEYVRRVIPAHALSEIANEKQLSLSYVAHQLGASDALALRLGSFSYLLALAAGLAAGKILSERLASPGLLLTLPVAFTLAGSPFIHIAQIAAAIPAVALLYAGLPERRVPLGFALGLLAIPWLQFLNLGAAFPLFVALAVLTLAWSLGVDRPLPAVALAVAAVFLVLVPEPFFVALPDPAEALARAYDPAALAEKTWDVFTHAIAQSNGLAYTLAKLPTWLGLFGVAAISLGETFRESGARHQEQLTASR